MALCTPLEDLKVMVAKIAEREGLVDYEIRIDEGSKEKNGFMGTFIFFEIFSKETEESHSLVMKYASKNDILNEIVLLESNFDREIYLYTTVFSSLNSFFSMKNESTKILNFIPRLYWFSTTYQRRALIFENLLEKGFTMWNKKTPLDMEHTVLVLKNLAKWHGLVMAYRDQNEENFRTWIPHLQDLRYKLFIQMGNMKYLLKNYRKILTFLENNGHKTLAEKYRKLEDNFEQYFKCAKEESDRLIISHGDCWINNVMFRYENENNSSSESKFIDFQLSCLDTPVADLSFFIFTTGDSIILDKLDFLLKEYYSALRNTINVLGSQADNVFTFDQLKRHWKSYAVNGLMLSIGVIKVTYMTEDEMPDFLKIIQSGETDLPKCFEIEMKNEEAFMRRISMLFKYFGNKYL